MRGPLIVRSRKTVDENSAKFLSVVLQEVRPQSRHFPAESVSFRTKLIEETFSTSKLYFKAPINLEMIINEVRLGLIRKGYIQ